MKRPIKLLGLTLGVCALSLSALTQEGSKKIDAIFSLKTAEAVCCSSPINTGRCTFFNSCYGNPGGLQDCDLTLGHCDNPPKPPIPPLP